MSDDLKAGLSQAAADITEAVVKPVADEVGQAIEQGVQSVVSTPKPVDPVAQQKKQQEEQKRKEWALKVIEFNKQLQSAQQQVRQENQQKQSEEQQKKQEEAQVKQYKIVEKQKKDQQLTTTQREARKTELRGGVGG
jgi:hypothetical protein